MNIGQLLIIILFIFIFIAIIFVGIVCFCAVHVLISDPDKLSLEDYIYIIGFIILGIGFLILAIILYFGFFG